MKNRVVLFLCVALSGCVSAGDYDLLPVRRQVLNSLSGYGVEYNTSDETFVGQNSQREIDYSLNKTVTVRKGNTVFSDKELVKNTYQKVVYRPSKNGAVNNTVFPLHLNRKQEYSPLGWVTIDGTRYGILESGLDDYVMLFDDDGRFFHQAGRIEAGVLKLLDEEVFVYPSDLVMQKVTQNRNEIDGVNFGYEVKYCGLQLDRLCFEYLEYDNSGGAGHFEQHYFPNKPGLISINGNGMRVLRADDDAMSFVLVKAAD